MLKQGQGRARAARAVTLSTSEREIFKRTKITSGIINYMVDGALLLIILIFLLFLSQLQIKPVTHVGSVSS